MIEKLRSRLNQRKVKVFSLFLLCSFLSWFISNLSETYESRTNFIISYSNLPDTLMLGKNSEDMIEAKIRASGFQFLYHNFFKKQIDVDVSQAVYRNGKYLLTREELRKQMDLELSQSVSILDLDRSELVVDMYRVASREIPIKASLEIQFEQNYLLDGEVKVTPDHVVVKGPSKEIDTIGEVMTSLLQLANVSNDFSREVPLKLPKGLENSVFSINKAVVSGKVSKFSEKLFEVPVEVLNIPEGYQVQVFPNKVTVVCKATIERLKEISKTDFKVVADYDQGKDTGGSALFLRITERPENVYDVRLQEGSTVNFILKQL